MPDDYGEQLASWGKVVLLETTGRVSGRTVEGAVGFVAGAVALFGLALFATLHNI